MKTMRKLLGFALLGVGAMAGAANAQETTVSGNVALTTDYAFRGISQTDENPAIQGGFDVTHGSLYAGVWASNVDFVDGTGNSIANLEIDLYGGIRPTYGPVAFDFGVVYYAYPNAEDAGFELDYVELKAGASITPAEGFSLGAVAFYSPEFTGEVGDGLYLEANAAYALTEAFSISGAVGNQSIDEDAFVDGLTVTDSYTTWNVGGTLAAYGFGFDLRYVDTDLDNTLAEERVILTVRRSL
jgi:uncharacterized protein (TIGR02001 family)